MVKTVSRGIRLPKKLWDLVKALNPDMTYSDIVHSALLEVYMLDEVDDTSDLERILTDDKKPVPSIRSIHDEIDSWGSYV